MRAKYLGVAGFLLSLASGSAPVQAAQRLIDLGTLGGNTYGTADQINDKGQVAGLSSRTITNGTDRPYSWTARGGMVDMFASNPTIDNAAMPSGTSVLAVTSSGQVFGGYSILSLGTITPQAFAWTVAGGLVGLGTLEGSFTTINAINDHGQAVGQSGNRAFSWTAAGGLVDLGLVRPTCSSMTATAISFSGLVVGYGQCKDSLGNPVYAGFLWTAAGGLVDIGDCRPVQVNDNGEITGTCGDFSPIDGVEAAFFRSATGTMFNLGATGQQSVGRFLNKTGEVVGLKVSPSPAWGFFWSLAGGTAYPSGIGVAAADVFGLNDDGLMIGTATLTDSTQRAFISQRGGAMELLSLGGTTRPRAVSGNGQVVGSSEIPSDFRGFSWTAAGGIVEMPILGGGAGSATAVNSNGQVAGQASLPGACGGTYRGVLWNTVPLPETPLSVTLPDINSDGVLDIGVMRDTPLRVEVRSGQNGLLLRTIPLLDLGATPLAIRMLPDSDGNGVAELAVLSARKSDGRGVVQIHNVTGPQAARQVWFAAGYTAVSFAVIASDADHNGVPEFAVLSTNNGNGQGLVEIRNAFGAENRNALWVGIGLAPSELQIVEDADHNGIPEVAVLSTRSSDSRIIVEIMNAYGAINRNVLGFMPCNAAIDLAVVNDADGNSVPEVAVLSARYSDGRNVVEVKNAAGPTNSHAIWLAAGYRALKMKQVADADGNGVPEVAVLSSWKIDGRILVEVNDAAGPANKYALWYPAGFTPSDLTIPGDLDGNGIDDAAVLLIRNSDNRMLVQSRNAAGAPGAKNYWLSP